MTRLWLLIPFVLALVGWHWACAGFTLVFLVFSPYRASVLLMMACLFATTPASLGVSAWFIALAFFVLRKEEALAPPPSLTR